MGKKSSGRMINTDISLSQKIATLSPEALALFCLLIPHFNSHGKMLAHPHLIKGLACPLIEWLTVPKIEKLLTEISQKTNVKFWQEKGIFYLHSINWQEHQELREDRLGPDKLPDYPAPIRSSPGPVPELSRSSPGPVPPEVEVEVEVEVEGKGEGKGSGKPDDVPVKEIIEDLNRRTGQNHAHNTKAVRGLISARWREGYRLDQFIKVNAIKTAEWINDSKMKKFLRPSTLYAAKHFDEYLNGVAQAEPENKPDKTPEQKEHEERVARAVAADVALEKTWN